ncbi:hypothetical protein C7M84_010249 [Penaeus vannamei]|uniref:Uncharacterized protein n=1 Tax=Penaeus vannamei TaxID=6689 RepID=A0A3R7M2X8_PENVA|nr:hypothetical protein C7M84_010249 [Penaeus vannamei]
MYLISCDWYPVSQNQVSSIYPSSHPILVCLSRFINLSEYQFSSKYPSDPWPYPPPPSLLPALLILPFLLVLPFPSFHSFLFLLLSPFIPFLTPLPSSCSPHPPLSASSSFPFSFFPFCFSPSFLLSSLSLPPPPFFCSPHPPFLLVLLPFLSPSFLFVSPSSSFHPFSFLDLSSVANFHFSFPPFSLPLPSPFLLSTSLSFSLPSLPSFFRPNSHLSFTLFLCHFSLSSSLPHPVPLPLSLPYLVPSPDFLPLSTTLPHTQFSLSPSSLPSSPHPPSLSPTLPHPILSFPSFPSHSLPSPHSPSLLSSPNPPPFFPPPPTLFLSFPLPLPPPHPSLPHPPPPHSPPPPTLSSHSPSPLPSPSPPPPPSLPFPLIPLPLSPLPSPPAYPLIPLTPPPSLLPFSSHPLSLSLSPPPSPSCGGSIPRQTCHIRPLLS